MAALVTGMVFNDLNHNGRRDSGEPGIPKVSIALYDGSKYEYTTTDSNGKYSFNIKNEGSYIIYETVAAGACPTDNFVQPDGFTMSNSPRKINLNITRRQINRYSIISGQNFCHDTLNSPLSGSDDAVTFAGKPIEWYDIRLKSQNDLNKQTSADSISAICCNPADNYIYGYSSTDENLVRIAKSGVYTTLPRPAGLPAEPFGAGAFDQNGYYHLYNSNDTRFYTVDLRPNSPTFLKLVNPGLQFSEQVFNFGTKMNVPADINSWVWNRQDGALYGICQNGVIVRITPASGQVAELATKNAQAAFITAIAADGMGSFYAIDAVSNVVYKYTVSGNKATASVFSEGFFADDRDSATDTTDDFYAQNNDDLHAEESAAPARNIIDGTTSSATLCGQADVAVSVSAESSTAKPGDMIVYHIKLSNFGPNTAHNLKLTDDIPSGVLNPQFSVDGGTTWSEWQGVYCISTAAAGFETNIQIKGTVDAGQVDDIFNTAEVTSVTCDQNPCNNKCTIKTSVTASADLSVIQLATPKPVNSGEFLNFTIMVSNAGPSAAENVIFTDILPAELLNAEFSVDGGTSFKAWEGSYNIGTMAACSTMTILLRAIARSDSDAIIVSTAEVTSSTSDPDFSNNSSTDETRIVSYADLSVEIMAQSAIGAGQSVYYTIDISNFGPSKAENTIIKDDLPNEITCAEYSLNSKEWMPWKGALNIGTLCAQQSAQLLIRGRVTDGFFGSMINTACVGSAAPDTDTGNNQSSFVTEVARVFGTADISVTKTVWPEAADPGDTLTYTIILTNNGPDDAQNVILYDAAPPELDEVQISSDGGVTWSGFENPHIISTLQSGQSKTILLSGIIAEGACGTVSNTAVVASSTSDPNIYNNTATAIIDIGAHAKLSAVMTASPNPAVRCHYLIYTITAVNAGPAAAEDVIISDQLPIELGRPIYSTNGGRTWDCWTGSVNIGDLESGEAATILLAGVVSPCSKCLITNTVLISSATDINDAGAAAETTVRVTDGCICSENVCPGI